MVTKENVVEKIVSFMEVYAMGRGVTLSQAYHDFIDGNVYEGIYSALGIVAPEEMGPIEDAVAKQIGLSFRTPLM